ncbi:hypothetical protein S83_017672 [Arachis hypogaea]
MTKVKATKQPGTIMDTIQEIQEWHDTLIDIERSPNELHQLSWTWLFWSNHKSNTQMMSKGAALRLFLEILIGATAIVRSLTMRSSLS